MRDGQQNGVPNFLRRNSCSFCVPDCRMNCTFGLAGCRDSYFHDPADSLVKWARTMALLP